MDDPAQGEETRPDFPTWGGKIFGGREAVGQSAPGFHTNNAAQQIQFTLRYQSLVAVKYEPLKEATGLKISFSRSVLLFFSFFF